jgi:Protein of unknown function (DUF3105)
VARQRQSAARRRRAEAAALRRRAQRRRALLAAGAAVATVVIVVSLVATRRGNGEPTIPGVQRFDDLSRTHVSGAVSYPHLPPVGGDHNQVWQNCGFYSAQIENEYAVHSLEHGAVWITYRPDLPDDQVVALRAIAKASDYVLVSLFPGLPEPVIASAWGRQLRLRTADDRRLERFVEAYADGPQAPERGGRCTGGVGQPEEQGAD